MCQDCGRIFCANRCPSYGGFSAERGQPRGACSLCGESFYPQDPIYKCGRRWVCETCYNTLLTDEEDPSIIDRKSLPHGIDLSF